MRQARKEVLLLNILLNFPGLLLLNILQSPLELATLHEAASKGVEVGFVGFGRFDGVQVGDEGLALCFV